MQRNNLGEFTKSTKASWPEWLWNASIKLLGHPPEMIESLERLKRQLDEEKAKSQESKQEIDKQLQEIQEQGLQWQAKEASTRKDLQVAQQRAKDLLEQVVQLTHKERQAKQSLFDQHFKTGTTPLERNSYEMEMAEARGRVKRAEEKAMLAEKKMAEMEIITKRAAKVKDLESEVAWLKKQTTVYKSALEAAIDKVRGLEDRLARNKPVKKSPSLSSSRRAYHKPSISKRRGRVDAEKAFSNSN